MPTMTAALYEPTKGFQIAQLPRPDPAPGMVIVRVGAAGICGSDLHYLPLREGPETIPSGHEGAGEVVAVGTAVTAVKPGDRVALEFVGLARACLVCWFCRQGQFVQCLSRRPGRGGAFAEYLHIAAPACFKFEDPITWEEGALVEPLAVAVHGVRLARTKAYETAVVLGSGTIGLATIAAVRALGAACVIATARYPHQAEMAKELGADVVLKPEDDEAWSRAGHATSDRFDDHYLPAGGSALWDAVASATDGRGADVVFESIGGTTEGPLMQAVALCRKQGRIVSIGAQKVPVPVNTIVMLRREQSLLMSHCYSVIDGRHDYEVSIDLIASGKAPMGKIVTHRFSLKDANRALETAASKTSGALKVQFVS